jgi:N-formylglutamate amidohydrolase
MDMPTPSPPGLEMPPPFRVARPARQTVPLVFASPHSGANYTPEFVAGARLDAVALRRSEDSFVDELFAAAPEFGAPLLAATFPRVYCDANREPWELDPGMFDGPLPAWVNSASPRVGAGLGTIARVVATGEPVYRHKLPFAEAEARVRSCWQPYHTALAALIEETRASLRLLPADRLPFHADPPDAHGCRPPTSCSATRTAPPARRGRPGWWRRRWRGIGYRVRRNDPYAGGYVTRHYGRAARGGARPAGGDRAQPLHGRGAGGARARPGRAAARPGDG